MAPKKKGEGKKKKKKKTEIQAATKAIEEVVTETQEFYHIQIRDLENRLDRYKEKWDEFSQQDKVFQEEFNQLAHNKKEVVSFLKRTLNQRVDEIADLNSQLQGLQISKEMEKDAFEARLAQVRHEFQETKDQLTMENIMLGGKLAALEEFQFQKADLLAKFSLLEDQLKKQRDDYKSYVCHMERKALMDKERLRKDIIHRINTVAAEFRRFSSSQMAETTKRAIRENVTVALGLAKINSGNLEQIKENNVLKESKEELCKQLALLERDEKTMAKNSLTHIKAHPEKTEACKIDILFQLGRKEMLQQLLDMLNEAVVVGPHIPEFVPPPINSPSIQSLMTTEESFKQPEPLPLLQQLANIQPYRIGDLGLVPHPPSTTEDGQDAATFRNLRSVKAFSNPEIPRPQILREIKQVSMPAFHLYPSVEGQQE
uniref:Cilia- and flagella-associated protein 157 n=1 Tax=Phascolarctos cinereus TaxID=38626 RepID=A0A6P5IR91_PHACI|nr:cilia- and flagella-associated protein 157-like isoform X2 [Phascolarctos cinereus]